MKKLLFVLIALWSLPALALDLQEARSQGLVGERLDGYVTPIAKSQAAVELSADVNAKRKAEYMRISKENGQPVDVVGKLAAAQIISALPSGAQYQDASGNWQKK